MVKLSKKGLRFDAAMVTILTMNANKSTAVEAEAELVSKAIQSRIGSTRRERGLTFDQLAALSGVSKGMLVQIEQGKANPSIGILCKVASALRVSVAELVETPGASPSPVRSISPHDTTTLWSGPNGGSAVLLVGTEGPDMLELWHWELHPGERFEAQPHSRGTRELLHVTQGTLELEVDGVSYPLLKGGSAVAQTERPHAYACRGSSVTKFTMVVFEPGR
ncbi:transcriptional regulator with XRE-family HTH domain [Sphingomonas kaistensis]|uniref:Transcriptional regulator with XRE-family HTH domain n=1 Tax=Sphingomonas kaistensis TaxID=298708 RepID=A0A7X5YA95_9SPHN|nr:helix-turn-helix transcriptional regulator [Sphingomonas kaistensis]NJC06431.1 transcriptional regulator with XRE-family HTH domain [Sphingomonas kaistensis]